MLAKLLDRYLEIYPEEKSRLTLLRQQINDDEALNDRRNFTGHVTASAVILSADKKKILLIHHKAYDQWQQPGGHWEKDDRSPLEAAKREGEEETGIKLDESVALDTENLLVPFDIDTHPVPARQDKNEPPHYHHDFRYVFLVPDSKPVYQVEEILAAEWLGFDDPKAGRVKKIIEKLRAANIIA